MSKKRDRARQRKAAREEAQKRRNRLYGGFLIAALVMAGALIRLISQGNSPLEPTARFELDPILGAEDAPVTIVEYGAYGCHACAQWHEAGVIEQIIADYPGQVRFIYRDMPIISPAYSQDAAEVAQCALDQGQDVFWRVHDALFTQAGPGSDQTQLVSLAAGQGPDVGELVECVDSGTHTDTVRYDLQRGNELGIRATPTFYINDQVVFNASPDLLRTTINYELARLGG